MQGLIARHQKDLQGATPEQLALLGGYVEHHDWRNLKAPLTTPLPYKLRILGGTQSPQWVKDSSSPFPYTEPVSGSTSPCPQWWGATPYRWEWERLQPQLRALYKPIEVAQGGGGTRYSEPFIRGTRSQANVNIYDQRGLTLTADREALTELATITANNWDLPLSQSMFPWQYVDRGVAKTSMPATVEQITDNPDCYQIVGAHDLRWPLDPFRRDYYEAIRSTGLPMYFQTAQPSKIGDWYTAIEYGITEYEAQYIELPRTWTDWPVEQLSDLAAMFCNT